RRVGRRPVHVARLGVAHAAGARPAAGAVVRVAVALALRTRLRERRAGVDGRAQADVRRRRAALDVRGTRDRTDDLVAHARGYAAGGEGQVRAEVVLARAGARAARAARA